MANRFEGKVAIVTGGNSGIGEATGRQFAAEGAKTVLMARREEQGQAVAESIRASGGEATFIRCDVSDCDSVEAAVAAAVETYGRIDVLFNNAGAGARGNFPDESNEDWDLGDRDQPDRHVLRQPRRLAAPRGRRRRRGGADVVARRAARVQFAHAGRVRDRGVVLLRRQGRRRRPHALHGGASGDATTSA